ncbi:DNA-binding domain-containing protein [Methyloferula stellata]|uniref:HvfC/BufC N-terminal domain-containing protein n=1 Tax=Methyloferula stellata TaxID=876270 RepID=UPI000369F588|nr:DNA-binding domain-containing protein [Methyloferula stellata]
MRLAELQTTFQDAILNEAREMPGSIMASRRQSAMERFGVYQDAYRLRLAEFLANDYPVLHNVLGDEGFDALAEAYIKATPSSHRNARWYARDLPDFMRMREPWQEIKAAIDLAAFERALADAFDAADADALEASVLGSIAAEDQPRLCFTFQPGLALLSLTQGTVGAYEAAAEGLDAAPPSGPQEERVLVWRGSSQQSFYRCLEEDEALALDSAGMGGTFAEICGLLSLRMPEEEAANQAALYLIRWFGDGLIAGVACG